jgi:hypothetical protein
MGPCGDIGGDESIVCHRWSLARKPACVVYVVHKIARPKGYNATDVSWFHATHCNQKQWIDCSLARSN